MTREEEAAKDRERHLMNREERIKRMRENYHEKRWRSKVDRGIEIWKMKMEKYLKTPDRRLGGFSYRGGRFSKF